jgi:transcriptional regulator with XRE-family HTH domain
MNSGPGTLATLLRNMRRAAGLSQLELALRVGMSQRHVSFVELGRARPSRDLILSWTRETGGSVEQRNAALLRAGYSPSLQDLGPCQSRTSSELAALSGMLDAHEPYPGMVFDADWMICAMNQGGQWLCKLTMADFVADMDGPSTRMDMIAAATHPGGLLSTVRNAAEAGFALLAQLRAEELTRPALGSRIDEYERSLRQRFGCRTAQGRAAGDPQLSIVMDTPFGALSFLLVQTIYGLPQNVTHASLRTELWFAVDGLTRRTMMTQAGGTRTCPHETGVCAK